MSLMKSLIILSVFCSINVFAQREIWTTKAPMPTARGAAGAASVGNIVYVIGGVSNLNEAYNITTNTWVTKAPMTVARGELGVATVAGKIYAIGGYNGSSAVNTVEEYDPASDTWTTKASMPTARSVFSVGVIGNKIYAVGGWPGNISALEVYDPATDTWVTKAPIPIGRQQIDGCAVVDGKLHLIGGKNDVLTSYYSDNYVYDTATDSWSSGVSLPFTRFGGAVAVLYNSIYYLGGAPGSASDPYVPNVSTNNKFDTTTSTWETKLSMLSNRSAMAVATVNNKIYLFGGYDDSHTALDLTEVYYLDSALQFINAPNDTIAVCENFSCQFFEFNTRYF